MPTTKTAEVFDLESSKQEVWELIQTLVAGQASANEILELYYWSREPGALDLMRNLAFLSEKDRQQLSAFLNSASCNTISVRTDAPGELTVSTSEGRGSKPSRRRQIA